MVKFLESIVIQKNIGNSGYSYDIADDICKRIYTIENENCSAKEYNNDNINNRDR